MKGALHFIGFKDDRVHIARLVFGEPDFYHRIWDGRAISMIFPGDTVVFADGDESDTPQKFSFDDSQTR